MQRLDQIILTHQNTIHPIRVFLNNICFCLFLFCLLFFHLHFTNKQYTSTYTEAQCLHKLNSILKTNNTRMRTYFIGTNVQLHCVH